MTVPSEATRSDPAAHAERVLLWCGGYSAAMGGTANGIGLIAWDGTALVFEGTAAPTLSPSYLAVDADVVVAVDEATGRVRTFVAEAGGALSPLGPVDGVETSGDNPCHVTAQRVEDARLLIAANYGDGSLDVFDRDDDGAVRDRVASLAGEGSGPRPEQDGPHAHSTLVVVGADGGCALLSADLGADAVHVHSLSGRGVERRSSLALPAGSGPRDLIVLDGRVLLLGEIGGEVFELSLDPVSPEGTLAIVSSGAIVSDPVEGDQAAGLAAGADGRFLYVGLRGSNRVAVMDAATLAPLASVPCGGDWPRHLAIVGDTLFVANQRSASVSVFVIDSATGMLSFMAETPVPTPTFLLPVPAARP